MSPMLIALLAGAMSVTVQQGLGQNSQYNRRAQLMENGAIFVSSDEGKLIKMADGGHCIEAVFAEDNQTVGCSVARGTSNGEELSQSQRLEIYLKNGRRTVIHIDSPITEWRFWEGGREVAISFRPGNNIERHVLYEAATGNVVQQTDDQPDVSRLPRWAKTRAQVQDEAVPKGEGYDRERTAWIAKSLRQIAKIQPGMRRDELTKMFTTEGGISTRFQRTYVYSECPYIKVNVQFRALSNEQDGLTESPDDVIVSISQPYLAWSVAD